MRATFNYHINLNFKTLEKSDVCNNTDCKSNIFYINVNSRKTTSNKLLFNNRWIETTERMSKTKYQSVQHITCYPQVKF